MPLVDEGLHAGDRRIPGHLGPVINPDIIVHHDLLRAFPVCLAVVEAVVEYTRFKSLGVDILGKLIDIVRHHVFPGRSLSQSLGCIRVEDRLVLGRERRTVKFHIFVSTDVEIRTSFKQLHILVIEAPDICHCLRIGHIQSRCIVVAVDIHLSVFRMGSQNLVHMAGAVKGRNNLDPVFCRFCQDLPHFLMGEVLLRYDRRIRLALDAESQVF